MKKPVILDVDTGLDDACALLLAARHPDLEVKAVTCVGGNIDLDNVVVNTLTVLEAAGRSDIPVAAGAALPLLQPIRSATHIHGEDGLGKLDWPRSLRKPDSRHAVEMLRDVLLASKAPEDMVTLIPLAPMTNIALLLRTYPEAADGLREIVFMGGAIGTGNMSASAEFNVWTDPEAAAVVLKVCAERHIPVTMYGLDVFYKPVITLEKARELRGSKSAELARKIIEKRSEQYGSSEGASIGDGGAVCAVIDPEGCTKERYPVRVELSGSWSRGRTIVDTRNGQDRSNDGPDAQSPALVNVVTSVKGRRYAKLWLNTVS